MYRLLAVDNEDYVVQGIVDIFQQLPYLDLEVIGAYSAREALDWLKRTKIDIVISDIRMPGMDGITLHREIISHWPECQVIFLSGFNDFQYVQRAIRGGAIDYVLKADGDDVLIAAVEKVIGKLREKIEFDKLIAKSHNQIHAASDAMRKGFFSNLLQGDRIGEDRMARQFKDLRIPLNSELAALPVVGRIKEWPKDTDYFDRQLLKYCIQNIAGEYLDTSVTQVSFDYDRYDLVWLIQPKNLMPGTLNKVQTDIWNFIGKFVQGTFEQIQESCKETLKLNLSIALSDHPVEWDTMPSAFANMKSKLGRTVGPGEGVIVIYHEDEDLGEHSAVFDAVYFLNRLGQALEHNRREEFKETLDQLLKREEQKNNDYLVTSLILFLQTQVPDLSIPKLSLPNQKLNAELWSSWNKAVDYLFACGEAIFDHKDRVSRKQSDELIDRVKRFIADHLAEDVSLTAISEALNHNPSYLSRLFKQKTGIGLTEHIVHSRIRKSQEMLENPVIKIQDIAESIGFASVQYFYRVFKKIANVTPQEYRESVIQSKTCNPK